MKRIFFTSALLMIVGCAPEPPSQRLIGAWSVAALCTLEADPEIAAFTPKVKDRLENFVKPYIRHMIFEFDEDGVYRVRRRFGGGSDEVYDQYFYRIVSQVGTDGLDLEISNEPKFDAARSLRTRFEGDLLKATIGSRTYCMRAY